MNLLPSKLPELTSSDFWKTAGLILPEKGMKANPDCAVTMPIAPTDSLVKTILVAMFVLRTRAQAGISA